MKKGLWVGVSLLVVIPLLYLFCCQVILTLSTTEISKSENPPATLRESDLVGTWKAEYAISGGVDKLILRADGTFKQIYQNQVDGYVYETPWNEWWLERFPDGRVRVHLKGARRYLDGIPLAETEDGSSIFCDPFALDREWRDWSVRMVGQLILNVRLLPSGELVLAHMWSGCGDAAFTNSQVFHRVATSSSSQTPVP